MQRWDNLVTALLLSAALALAASAQEDTIPAPGEFLGFEIGADRQLADWEQISSYYRAVAEKSPRVQLAALGKSAGGRAMIAAYISSEENLANLFDLFKTQWELTYLPAAEDEGARWAGHKLFVLVNCSIHSTEIGASQMSMRLLHRLATREDEETRMIRDRLVVILIPSPNPDGIDMVAEWYRRWLGTPYEGCSPPLLYQKYAGHDNNRDWYALNLQETKVITEWLYKIWFPLVVWDAHQMGSKGYRAIVPPHADPPNPFIHPLVLEGIAGAGHAMKAQALRDGYRGLAHGTRFTVWWNGGFRTTPYFKNSIGLLTELASARLATPVEVTEEELSQGRRGPSRVLEKTVSNPAPWRGGTWRLADIVATELSLARGLLRHCALNADRIIADYRRICLDARAATDGGPVAYLLPREQHDPAALERLVEILQAHGIEVLRLAKPATVGESEHPKGTVLVSGFQPYRPFIRSMFERLKYPESAAGRGGPYDVSGWTLVDQLGLEVRQVSLEEWGEAGLESSTEAYEKEERRIYSLSTGETFYPAGDTGSFREINEIILQGGLVYREYPVEGGLPRAQEFVHYNPNHDASDMNISGKIEEARRRSLNLPRLGLLRGYFGSMDEGWTRLLLERFGFPYDSLDEAAVKAGNLGDEFDVIILPNIGGELLAEGREEEDYPPEFQGGLGQEGLENLDRFVREGGTLICLGGACRTAIELFGLPVKDILKDVEREEFSIPGSLVRIHVDTSHPIAFGMQEQPAAMFTRSLAFAPAEEPSEDREQEAQWADGVEVIASYADENLLISGFARNGELIAGKAAALSVGHGEGRVVLIGFACQFRGQPYATFKLLFNSIYMTGDSSPRALSIGR